LIQDRFDSCLHQVTVMILSGRIFNLYQCLCWFWNNCLWIIHGRFCSSLHFCDMLFLFITSLGRWYHIHRICTRKTLMPVTPFLLILIPQYWHNFLALAATLALALQMAAALDMVILCHLVAYYFLWVSNYDVRYLPTALSTLLMYVPYVPYVRRYTS
jgi:hypothetical protein